MAGKNIQMKHDFIGDSLQWNSNFIVTRIHTKVINLPII